MIGDVPDDLVLLPDAELDPLPDALRHPLRAVLRIELFHFRVLDLEAGLTVFAHAVSRDEGIGDERIQILRDIRKLTLRHKIVEPGKIPQRAAHTAKVVVFPERALTFRRIGDKRVVDDLFVLFQKRRVFRARPFAARDDAVNDRPIVRHISHRAAYRLLPDHLVEAGILRQDRFDECILRDDDRREAPVLAVFVDRADELVQIQPRAAQVVEDQHDPLLLLSFVILVDERVKGDVFDRVDGGDRGGNAAADRIGVHQEGADRVKQAVFSNALVFPVQPAQKRRTGADPLPFDRAAQRRHAVHAEQRDANDVVCRAQRLRQILFDQMRLPAAPLAGEQKRAQTLLLAAVANQLL